MKVQRYDSHRPTNAEGSGLRRSILFEEAMEVTVIASLSPELSHGSAQSLPLLPPWESRSVGLKIAEAINYGLARARPQGHGRRHSKPPCGRGARRGPELPVAVFPQHPLLGQFIDKLTRAFPRQDGKKGPRDV